MDTPNDMTKLALHYAAIQGDPLECEDIRSPGSYGVGGPGPGGQTLIVRSTLRNIRARIDVASDGTLKVYPMDVGEHEAVRHREFWEDLLAHGALRIARNS